MGETGEASLRLPPSPRSPRLAREFAERFLRDAGREELAARASLVVSELVTNALVHTTGGCRLTVRLVEEPPPRVRVEVADGAAGASVEPTAHGTGLRVVGDAALAWGVERETDGKTVWAELA